MNVTAKQLVDVETLTVEVREERRAFLTCRLQKDVDEKRTAGKLLHDQIACGFTRRDLLASRDVFYKFCCFGWSELFETQDVEPFEITFRGMSGFEDLAAQTCKHE